MKFRKSRGEETFEETSAEEVAIPTRELWSFIALSISVIVFLISVVITFWPDPPDIAIVLLASFSALFLLLFLRYYTMYYMHKRPRDKPKLKNTKRFSGNFTLKLDPSLPFKLWQQEPPLFTVAKDYEDVADMQYHASQRYEQTYLLKSLKWGAISDLVSLSLLAQDLAIRWKNGEGNLKGVNQLEDTIFCVSGIDYVENLSFFATRSSICIGGGDTNPASAHIVKEFAEGYGCYPPARFTVSSSEALIVHTEHVAKRWFFSESEGQYERHSGMGLIFATYEPPVAFWEIRKGAFLKGTQQRIWWSINGYRSRKVQLLLAGLHKEGTRAACQILTQLMRKSCDNHYKYHKITSKDIPAAVVEWNARPKIPLPLLKPVDVTKEWRRELQSKFLSPDNKWKDWGDSSGSEVQASSPCPQSNNHPSSYLQLKEACRVVDFVIRYSMKHLDNEHRMWIIGDFEILKNSVSMPDCKKNIETLVILGHGFRDKPPLTPSDQMTFSEFQKYIESFPNLKEILLIGTEEQNDCLALILHNNNTIGYNTVRDQLDKVNAGSTFTGAIVVCDISLGQRKIRLVLTFGGLRDSSTNGGNTSNRERAILSTQAAILGLCQKTATERLCELKPGKWFMKVQRDRASEVQGSCLEGMGYLIDSMITVEEVEP